MNKKAISFAVGTAFAATLSAGVASADVNPFTMSKLDQGYQLAMSDTPSDDKMEEGKCGGSKKMEEGKCGGSKKMEEGKCGGAKQKEGKCGEGKCGGAK